MPMTTVIGKGGSGKNTILTYLLLKNKKLLEFQKFSNFELLLPNTKKLDTMEFFELEEEDTGEPMIALYDEAYAEDLDNRDSMTVGNKLQSYLGMQSRKNNMTIATITQTHNIDIRFRQMEESIIKCLPRPIYDKDFNDYKGDFHYVYINHMGRVGFTLPYSTAKKVFPFFKTGQKILPKDFEQLKWKKELANPRDLLDFTSMIARNIKKLYPDIKYTHDNIKRLMLELYKDNVIPYLDLAHEKYVYIELKDIGI